jgi:hypothetical protein
MENRLSILNFEASVVPEFKEARGKDWILYGAEGEFKNRYPPSTQMEQQLCRKQRWSSS